MNLKYYVALWLAKMATIALRIMGRDTYHFPGRLAKALVPDFLRWLPKPPTVIAVTGSNGKTTVTNMIADILRADGYTCIDNGEGGNVQGGVITGLLKGVSWAGRCTAEYAVLEIDELIYENFKDYLIPNYFLCTNLSRDHYERVAHVDCLFDALQRSLSPKSTLILNADDLISSQLAPSSPHVYYGVDWHEEKEPYPTLANDLILCPRCDHKLDYDYVQYNHIGKATCPNCGFTNIRPDYAVVAINGAKNELVVNARGQKETYTFDLDNIIDAYNVVAVISVLRELNMSAENVAQHLAQLKKVASRYDEHEVAGKKVIFNFAKTKSPIGSSRSFEQTRDYPGDKVIILLPEDDQPVEIRDSVSWLGWLYDTDCEFLNDDSIKQIVIGGWQAEDFRVRLNLAGVPDSKIVTTLENQLDTVELVDTQLADTIFILNQNFFQNKDYIPDKVLAKLLERLEAEASGVYESTRAATRNEQQTDDTQPIRQGAHLTIEVLFPDVCTAFGEGGNVLCLETCLPDATLIKTSLIDQPYFVDHNIDMIVIGPSTERYQEKVIARLMPHRDRLRELIENDVFFLVTGNALEVFGQYIEADDGRKIEALGLFNVWAKRDMKNRVSAFVLAEYKNIRLTAYKAQFTMMYGDNTELAFANVLRGFGLNRDSMLEGIAYRNFIGTYLLGPLLILNPAFTRDMLQRLGIENPVLPFEQNQFKAYDVRLRDFENPKIVKNI